MSKKKSKYQVQMVDIASITNNEENPRYIREDQFKLLCDNIERNPSMLHLRPIVVDADGVALGGNMRLRAMRHLGHTEVPVIKADDLTQEELENFVITDNMSFGEWDWDMIANNWDEDTLINWGLFIPSFDPEEENEVDEEQRSIHEMELKFNEHHDYVVFLFENQNDWVTAVSRLQLKKSPVSLSPKTKKLGIGRVLKGELLNSLLSVAYEGSRTEQEPIE